MTDYSFLAAGMTDVGGNPKKENQDVFITDSAAGLMGVFDGHGLHGLKAAEIASRAALYGDSFAQAEAVFKAHLLSLPGVVATPDGNVSRFGASIRGGTTASVVRVNGRKVTVEHVGDSEVIVVDCSTGDFKMLTNDHSSTSVAEYERVLREASVTPNVYFDVMPGRGGSATRPVFTLKNPPPTESTAGLWELNPTGGHYVSNVRRDWAAYVSSGDTMLNMFRAIGDFGLKRCGVTCVPDRIEHLLPAEGRSVILVASDGLFDPLQYEAIRDCIQANKTKTPAEICAAVLALGLAEGKKLFGSGQDNTTVCVGVVDSPQHPKELCVGEPIGLYPEGW
jgi:serine/threonine protein phosphatase PrpC